jgi:hypothetical protein
MIHLLLTLCAFAEAFLLWFMAALIREGRHSVLHTGKANRTPRGLVSGGTLHGQHTRTRDLREDENRLNLAIRVKFRS